MCHFPKIYEMIMMILMAMLRNFSVDGRQNIRKKLPNSMASWVITGFSMDPVNGLGLTKESQMVTTSRPFFVSIDLPYSVKRGEVLTVPVAVHNNLNRDLDTDITFYNEEQEFDFVEMNDEMGDNPSEFELIHGMQPYFPYIFAGGNMRFITPPPFLGCSC